jgi:nickel/cobalt transporter (NicO) family protein
MKNSRILLILIAILFARLIEAHPMGNFSISHYSRLEYIKDGVLLTHIVDMAEIPSYQEMEFLDTDHNSTISDQEKVRYAERISNQLLANLKVKMNNVILTFKIQNRWLEIRPGAGDLPTFVIHCTYFAGVPDRIITASNTIEFEDQNFLERSGWREIVIKRDGGFGSLNLPANSYIDRSKGLSKYPTDPTSVMPQETKLSFNFANPILARQQQTSSDVQSASGENVRPGTLRNDRLAKLITTKNLTSEVIFISLIIAFFLGAMHALSPGHGKAIVAGYLVGSRGTALHALFLGGVVTLTHTIGVFALGIITLFGSKYILPDTLYPWLGFLSGLSIVLIGSRLFYKRFKMMKSNKGTSHHHHHHHHDHDHSHDHHGHHHHDDDHDHHEQDHHHDHGHSHLPVDPETGKITWKSLLSVGISGGALPCPSALVVLLSAISLHRVGFGLILIIAFSLGLAAVLTSIGLLLLYASKWSQKFQPRGSIRYALPVVSSLVITILGCIIAVQSILQIN